MYAHHINLDSNGVTLAGKLYAPDDAKTYPALCICHGIPATPQSPNREGYSLLAQRFCQSGFLTLIFNFRGTGASEGNIDMLGWSQDLGTALDYLHQLEQADSCRLAVLGFSGGAAVAIYVSSYNMRVACLASCACPASFDFLTNREQGQQRVDHFRRIGAIREDDFPPSVDEWLNGFQEVSPIRYVHRVSPRPLLIIHGDADDVVPVDQAHMLYQHARQPKRLFIVHDGQHRLRLDDRAMTAATKWLHSTLCV